MKKTINRVAAFVVAVFVMACAVGCGDSQADKIKKLDAAAAAVDSVLRECPSPVADVNVKADGTNILVSLAVNDSLVHADLIGDALMDMFISRQIKSQDAAVVNQTVKAIGATGGEVKLSVTDLYGGKGDFTFNAETLRFLGKAKVSELNVPRVKEQLCAMLQPTLPNATSYADADHVEMVLDHGFLTYQVVFTSDKAFASSGQGLLTRYYLDPFKCAMASLGCLGAPFVDMCKSLSIDGFCVIFKALNGDKEIRQAFPWRLLYL